MGDVKDKVLSMTNKVIIGVATTAIASLLAWVLFTVNANEDKIKIMEYQENVYNSLFQELYEYHSIDKTFLLRNLNHKKSNNVSPAMPQGSEDTNTKEVK